MNESFQEDETYHHQYFMNKCILFIAIIAQLYWFNY